MAAQQRTPSYSGHAAKQGAADSVRSLTLAQLTESYALHLRAEGKTTATVDRTYLPALARFDGFLEREGLPREVAAIRREHIEAYLVGLQGEGKKPATVNLAFREAFNRSGGGASRGELRTSPMERMKAPTVPENAPGIVSEEEQRRPLGACAGSDYDSRRDRAILSLLIDTGMRRGECAGLRVADVDLHERMVRIDAATSKSRRARLITFGHGTARALDRYLRLRRARSDAGSPSLWLGKRGR